MAAEIAWVLAVGSGTGRGTGGLGNVDLGGRGKGKYKVSVGRTIAKAACRNRSFAGYSSEHRARPVTVTKRNFSVIQTSQVGHHADHHRVGGSVYVLVCRIDLGNASVESTTAGSGSSLPTLRGRRYG